MASSTPSVLQSSLASLAALTATVDNVSLTASSLSQTFDDTGNLIDTVELYWNPIGRGGTFTTRVPNVSNWQAIAFYQLGLKHATVEGIYDGLASKDDLPPGPTAPPDTGFLPAGPGTIPLPGVPPPV